MQSGNPALNKNTFLDAASGAVVSRGDETMTLTPLLRARSRMRSSISSRPFGSMPLVGSSRNSRSGSWTSACASLMRCFMPVEYVSTSR